MNDAPLIGTRMSLTKEEVATIKSNASSRYGNNRKSGVHDAARGPRRGTYYDILGTAGEWCFAKLFGGEFDASVHTRSSAKGQDSGDIIYRGTVVQVKTTDRPNGRLLAPPWAHKDRISEVYALIVMIDKTPTFEFRGFAPCEMLIADSNLMDLGHGPSYVLDQSMLLEENQIPWAD